MNPPHPPQSQGDFSQNSNCIFTEFKGIEVDWLNTFRDILFTDTHTQEHCTKPVSGIDLVFHKHVVSLLIKLDQLDNYYMPFISLDQFHGVHNRSSQENTRVLDWDILQVKSLPHRINIFMVWLIVLAMVFF